MKPIDEIKSTQAIIVLTGGNGRINEGLNMLAQKIAPTLFISGVNKDTTKKDIFNSWKNPTSTKPCCLTLGYKSTDTITNATEVKQWVTDNNIDEFHLVTSSYHMPRAAMEIRNQLPEKSIIKHPVFSDDFQSWKGRFWKLTFSEYNKFLIRWMQNLGA
jgi:uncharacterized SAM-binding protein YcdF (DUF218 family)